MENKKKNQMAKFLIPSIIGIILFMIPIKYDGSWTIFVKIIADMIGSALGGVLPVLCVIIVTVSAVMSLISLGKPKFITEHVVLKDTFSVSIVWVIVRILGAVFIWLTFLEIGASGTGLLHMITDGGAGGFVLGDLLTVLVIIFLIAALLLPLLLDFGLLEFVGAMLTRVMRPLFKIPGRAAVDCITSWIGDGTLGVMLTCNQYESGYYSTREASVISTTFSAVSITFSIVVLAQVDLMQYFGLYYLLICLIGVICAIIVPRIPPLSLKKDTYLVEGKAMPEKIPSKYNSTREYGVDLAMQRVQEQKGIGQFFQNGMKNAVGMWFGVLPTVMAIGTIALVLANNTPIFEFLGKAFLPLLQVLQVPEAVEASKTMIVGFIDMFTPSIIIAESVTNAMTKFIVAVVSVTQLIYLSEVGGLILASKLPVKLWELFLIFLERTIISLIIVCPIAHLIF
ncbi:YjiH family protein [Anaerovorax odorimutans]|uniref:YjiH family protein n=1 Tax=Anaerovorax odorimutans TaxID=109327 RepID=A0ABT1RSN4_9FIRM|nr:YjiH family protein [Anaerovorax odorimutans]MCQ4637871.1 YjiH family protein [Anaerovorax odorimutans]